MLRLGPELFSLQHFGCVLPMCAWLPDLDVSWHCALPNCLEPWKETNARLLCILDSAGRSLKWNHVKYYFQGMPGLDSLTGCCSSEHPLLHSTSTFLHRVLWIHLLGGLGATCLTVPLKNWALLSCHEPGVRNKMQFAIAFFCAEFFLFAFPVDSNSPFGSFLVCENPPPFLFFSSHCYTPFQ